MVLRRASGALRRAAWPLFLAETHPALAIVVAALNLGLLTFVRYFRSTPARLYWRSLNIIAGASFDEDEREPPLA
jgi:hypothetical protein